MPAPLSAPIRAPVAGIDAEDIRISKMIQKDLKDYWLDPYNKVLKEPIRAIVYSVAIKIFCMFLALIFPFMAYTTFGLSIALIDRIAYNNFSYFFQRVINCCKDAVTSRVISITDKVVDVIDDFVASM